MPRAARKMSRSGIYHIMMRGINRQIIFENDNDVVRLIDTIKKFKEISNYEIYAYCIMNNHFHLLLKEIEEPLSIIIRRISASYVFWYNKKYERCGHLFQERFKSEVVEDDEYFLTVLRYIHQNPIKAGITNTLAEYRWSSYNEYLHGGSIIDIDFVLDLFSEQRDTAIKLFKKFNALNNMDECLEYEEKSYVSDEEIVVYLYDMGVKEISEIKELSKVKKYEVLRRAKSIKGVTVRQLARLTGIAKSLIDRV